MYSFLFFFFKQKTAYEIYQCDWSSDVCSSDLIALYENILTVLYLKKELMSENKNKVENYIRDYENNQLCDATLMLDLVLTKENSFIETRNKYNDIKPKLLEIRPLCVKNQETVLSCQEDYNNLNYCLSTKCLNLKLNPQNAYSNTISDLKSLLPQLKEAKAKCSSYTMKIKKWQIEYNNKEYDKLYSAVLGVNTIEKRFIPPKYKEQFEIIAENLKQIKQRRKIFYNLYIKPIEEKINNIRNSSLSYFKAQDDIQFLTNLINKLNSDYKNKYHNTVYFLQDVNKIKDNVDKTINKLSIYMAKNKPREINLVKLYNDFAGKGLFGDPIYTEIQAETYWNNDYKGKIIIGSGIVDNVKERFLNLGTYITIQVTPAHYVDLYLAPSEENKSFLLSINKGNRIKFIGTLDRLGTGIMIHHTIKNVRIIGIY